MYLLTIGRNGVAGESIELKAGVNAWFLGRDANCDIVLKSSMTSRRHAKLTLVEGQFFVEDIGSSKGSFLEGARITGRVPIAVGQRLRLGEIEVMLSPQPIHPLSGESEEEEAGTKYTQQVVGGGKPLEFKNATLLYSEKMMELTRKLHNKILEEMHLVDMAANFATMQKSETRRSLERTMNKVLRELWHEIPRNIPMEDLKGALLDELINYGPISSLLRSDEITEVMVNGANRVFIEKQGKLFETGIHFFNDQHLISIIQRIVEPLGRHIDDSSPMVDARLPDGSRVNAVIPPLALDGPSLTIRKFARRKLTTEDLVEYKTLTPAMAEFLEEAVKARRNIIISGGTGSGKTTLLNILSQFIPLDERLVTIEDSAELRLSHRNLVRMEARPANIEGKGRISIRDLLVNSLRMRPDRIIIGECRAGEALDMLQAMNTGHDGSLTTIHANNPRDALSRLENMVLMAGFELPVSAIREQTSSAINLIVQQNRMVDGTRKITKITEVCGREGDTITLQDIFTFEQEGVDSEGHVKGHFAATGNIPHFIESLRKRGRLRLDLSMFSKSLKVMV